jgi:hypothetical protein
VTLFRFFCIFVAGRSISPPDIQDILESSGSSQKPRWWAGLCLYMLFANADERSDGLEDAS